MTPEQQAAFIHSQTACMLAEMEAMKAANVAREVQGHSYAYGEDEFRALPDRFGLGHNTVVTFFHPDPGVVGRAY